MTDAPATQSASQPAVFLTVDADGVVTNYDEGAAAAAGREHLNGERFADLLGDDDAEDASAVLDAARRDGRATLDAAFGGAPDQRYALTATELADGAVAVHGTPVTHSTGIEESFVDRMTDAFFALDDDWRLTYVNEEARQLLSGAMGADYSREEMLGREVWAEVPDAVDTTFYDAYHEAMATQEPVFFEEYYEPLEAWLDVRAFPSASGLSVYFRDVTERRRRVDTLEERERVLRSLYDVTSDGERPFADRVETLLEIGARVLGVEYGTLSRISGEEYIFEHVHAPADADLEPGEVIPLESTNCERAAATQQTLVLADVERDAPDLASRSGNADWGISCYLGAPITVEGEVYGTFCFYDMEVREEPFDDWEVTVVDLMAQWVSNELTDRRIRERLERQNDQLEDFASIVSHDLRNPLNVLDGSLELAQETGEAEYFERSQRAVDRMAALIEDLLSLARTGESVADPEPTDLASVAADSWDTVDTAGATLAVETTATIQGDASRLRQLFGNLFRNAVEHGSTGPASHAQQDAVEDGSTDSRTAEHPDDAVEHGGGDEDDLTVTVGDLADGFYVADDGPGIPDSDRETVFDQGFTTSEDGTGFGLAIVANVADAHGWTVDLTESESGGARFEFTGVQSASEI